MCASCARNVDTTDLALPFPDLKQAICCSLHSTSLQLPFRLSIVSVHHDISLTLSRGRVCSRDPEVWKDMDVLIDVGGEYDPEKLRYDHHQRGFAEVFGHGFSTKLSSAGLVYKHHGKELVASAAPTHSPCLRPHRSPTASPRHKAAAVAARRAALHRSGAAASAGAGMAAEACMHEQQDCARSVHVCWCS